MEEGILKTQRSVHAGVCYIMLEDPPDDCALWECSGDITYTKVIRLAQVRKASQSLRSSMAFLLC